MSYNIALGCYGYNSFKERMALKEVLNRSKKILSKRYGPISYTFYDFQGRNIGILEIKKLELDNFDEKAKRIFLKDCKPSVCQMLSDYYSNKKTHWTQHTLFKGIKELI